jgi:hypothetical protein
VRFLRLFPLLHSVLILMLDAVIANRLFKYRSSITMPSIGIRQTPDPCTPLDRQGTLDCRFIVA